MNKVKKYVTESYDELVNKVTWPTWDEVQESVVIVLVASIIFSLIVYLMDFTFSKVLSLYYNLFA